MTTIAVDRQKGLMAADTQMTDEGIPVKVFKIRRINGHLVGGAGSIRELESFWQAMESGSKKVPKSKATDVILLTKDGNLFTFEHGVRIAIADRFYAVGSGRTAALSSLRSGRSIRAAVKEAMSVDICTGGGIQIERLR